MADQSTCEHCGRPTPDHDGALPAEGLDLDAMADRLRRAGYRVSPPGPVRLRGVPPIDLRTDHEPGK